MPPEDECIPVRDEADIVVARQRGRHVAETAGFAGSDLTLIATAISELARNIVDYAEAGQVCVGTEAGDETWVLVTASDQGPGILDVDRAMMDGYSTGGGLGLGLPGVKRLMDEFEILSSSQGTTIRVRKRLRR